MRRVDGASVPAAVLTNDCTELARMPPIGRSPSTG
jgi:hypothetical protein